MSTEIITSAEIRRAVRLAPLVILWFGLAPPAFTVLYSIIELQAETRTIGGGAKQLSRFEVVRLAERLDQLEARDRDLRRLRPQIEDKLDCKSDAAAAAEMEAGLAGASLLNAAGAAKGSDMSLPANADPERMAVDADIGLSSRADSGDASASHARSDLRQQLAAYRVAKARAQLSGAEIQRLRARISAIDEERIQLAAMEAMVAKERLASVVQSYRTLHGRLVGYVVQSLFTLPQSAVVAMFTALMGTIGAAVASLALEVAPQPELRPNAYQAYFVRPFLGGLAGFMVFFVVSAGATFLMRPSGALEGGAGELANQLSPAALASLGVFAGLSSEAALTWLRARASAFFTTGRSNDAA